MRAARLEASTRGMRELQRCSRRGLRDANNAFGVDFSVYNRFGSTVGQPSPEGFAPNFQVHEARAGIDNSRLGTGKPVQIQCVEAASIIGAQLSGAGVNQQGHVCSVPRGQGRQLTGGTSEVDNQPEPEADFQSSYQLLIWRHAEENSPKSSIALAYTARQYSEFIAQ